MKCPRDRSVLVFTDEGALQRNKCPSCKGVLLGGDELSSALGAGAGSLTAERIAALPASTVTCPRDGSRMGRLDHEGVELDLCGECRALWVDAGELEKIAAMGKKKKTRRAAARAAVAGGAALAVGAAAAAQPGQSSMAADVARAGVEIVGEFVADGAIEIALEFVGEAIGSVLGSLF